MRLLLPWLLLACTGPGEEKVSLVDVGEESLFTPLESPRLLRRMSLDLRGVLPSIEELDSVEAEPALLESLLDAYLDDPRLEKRLVSMFSERWHTRMDEFELQYFDFHLDPAEEFEFERSVGEEPLRLLAHVAMEDLSWTEVVTADYTMGNELLAEIWELDYPEGEEGWQVSYYTDARPAVGVLSSNGLWWRYVTNISNQNRSRAAAMSSLLLCEDMLSRPVSLAGSVSLADEDGATEAIRTEPACIACHATIEPLASAMFGFWTVISYNPLELSQYHAEREMLGETYLGFAPAYFGTPLQGLVDLGPAMAKDPRFSRCAVEGAASDLLRREMEIEDFALVDLLHEGFLDDGMRYRALLREVMKLEEYQAGALSEQATEEDQIRVRSERLLVADQMATIVQDLTGFEWTWQGFEQMANDDPGYRVMAGGVDGVAVTRPQQDPGVTWALIWTRLTQVGAAHLIAETLGSGNEEGVLAGLTRDHRPGEEVFARVLEDLFWRLYAERPGGDRLEELTEFWEAIDALEGPEVAWASLVSVMLRDPEFIGY